jgi:hypothetical protein
MHLSHFSLYYVQSSDVYFPILIHSILSFATLHRYYIGTVNGFMTLGNVSQYFQIREYRHAEYLRGTTVNNDVTARDIA